MLWLLLVTPLIILIPIVIYFDKRGAGHPKLDSENHRIEQDLARSDMSFISHGGDGQGNS
jgi:hypothetical protein